METEHVQNLVVPLDDDFPLPTHAWDGFAVLKVGAQGWLRCCFQDVGLGGTSTPSVNRVQLDL